MKKREKLSATCVSLKKNEEDMNTYGNKMSQVQTKMKGLHNILQAENPDLFVAASGQASTESAQGSTASGQTGLQSVYADTAKL